MRLYLDRLREAGIHVEIIENAAIIDFHVEEDSREARDLIREACAVMGFNDAETETVFGEVHRVSIMSAIRRCSNW